MLYSLMLVLDFLYLITAFVLMDFVVVIFIFLVLFYTIIVLSTTYRVTSTTANRCTAILYSPNVSADSLYLIVAFVFMDFRCRCFHYF